MYAAAAKMLLALGATVGAPEAFALPAGSDGGASGARGAPLSLLLWPRVVLGARFAATYAQLRERAPRPDAIEVGAGATLVVDGDVTIEALSVAPGAALVLRAAPGARVRVRSLRVENAGWRLVPAPDDASEAVRARGYAIERRETLALEYAEGEHVIDDATDGGFGRRISVQYET